MNSKLNKAYWAVAAVSFFWGTTYLFTRIAVTYLPGYYLAGIRQLISGFLLVAFFNLKGFPWPSRKTWTQIIVESVLLVCLGNGLLTYSMEYIPSGTAAVISSLIPLFVSLFNVVFIGNIRLTAGLCAGLVLGVAGIFLIVYHHALSANRPHL
ncbi:MAG: EamA family transporter [Chitinophagaceae bacterium]|nr:EamA family transporter [Chitinophagaceae bacterium]